MGCSRSALRAAVVGAAVATACLWPVVGAPGLASGDGETSDRIDTDHDRIADHRDNCPSVPNPLQEDGAFLAGPNVAPASPILFVQAQAVDLNADGHVDIAWMKENQDGDQQVGWTVGLGEAGFGRSYWRAFNSSFYYMTGIFVADLDADGDEELAWVGWKGFGWFPNRGDGWSTEMVVGPAEDRLSAAVPYDFDVDGDSDVVAVIEPDLLVWYENLTGGVFRSALSLGFAQGPLLPVDLDADGDDDLVATGAESESPRLVLYEFLGPAEFRAPRAIAASPRGVLTLDAADVDGNGLPDILATSSDWAPSRRVGEIAWYPNHSGGTLSPRRVLHACDPCRLWPRSAVWADLDATAGLDILTTMFTPWCYPICPYDDRGRAFWYRNQGDSTFAPSREIAAESATTLSAEIDGVAPEEALVLWKAIQTFYWLAADGVGQACDNCPEAWNPDQADVDADAAGDSCDNCPEDPDADASDWDGDGVGAGCDNCLAIGNPDQGDADTDGIGDACDACTGAPLRGDSDADGEGDACDLDDGILHLQFTAVDKIAWHPEGYFRWNLYRGDLETLRGGGPYTQAPGSNPQVIRACNLQQPEIHDRVPPAPGVASFFLVNWTTVFEEGDLGAASDGSSRPNANPCL